MSKVFTAQEMRQRADEEERHWHDHVTAAMLRQAAADLEREKEYEYAIRYPNGSVSKMHYNDIIGSKSFVFHTKILRRPVGEWEEVNGEVQDS